MSTSITGGNIDNLVVHGVFGDEQAREQSREQVQAPRLKTSAAQQVSRAKLAGKTRFAPQQATEFPFGLDLPDLGCPSRRTEHTTVTHTLEAALTRRLRANYKLFLSRCC